MKYIIEIEDEPFGRNDDPVIPHGLDELYRAKGFNSLVFDQFGLDKLTPLDTVLEEVLEEAYQKGFDDANKTNAELCKLAYNQGLNDTWECARKISLMSPDEIEKVFPGAAKYNRYNLGYSGTEAIEKLKAYEQQKADEIKVGDEVTPKSNDSNWKGVVVGIEGEEAQVMTDDGYSCGYRIDIMERTGRHFPQVAELLKAMKEGAE